MGALERRGVITDPRVLPRLRPEAKPQAPQPVEKPERPVFPKSRLVDEKPQPQLPQLPRLQEAPKQQPVDAFGYVSKLVERGVMSPEQGMQLMGKSDQERQRIVAQYQAQEQQAIATLKEQGIYDQVMRINQINKELAHESMPIEGAYAILHKRFIFPGEYMRKEWRDKKDLTQLSGRKRLINIFNPLRMFDIGPATKTDTVYVDNPDGTQTRYVDRSTRWFHRGSNTSRFFFQGGELLPREEGVYKEVYGKQEHGKRKLLSRARAGYGVEITQQLVKGTDGKPWREYLLLSDKFPPLVREQQKLQKEIVDKTNEYAFSKIVNMGGTEYQPTAKLQKARKILEGSISRLLTVVKNTPKEKVKFFLRNLAITAGVSTAFVFGLPVLTAALVGVGVVGGISLGAILGPALFGAGIGLASQLFLFDFKESRKFMGENKKLMAYQALTMGSLYIPGIGMPLWAALTFGVPMLRANLPQMKKMLEKPGHYRQFKKDHPELTNNTQRKEAFSKEYDMIYSRKALDKFIQENAGWYEQVKKLNPHVSDDLIKQGLIERAQTGKFSRDMAELQGIQKDLTNKYIGFASSPRYGSAFATYLLVAGLNLFGQLSPVTRIASVLLPSSIATGVQVQTIKKSLGKVKEELATTHPELVPELRGQPTTRQTS